MHRPGGFVMPHPPRDTRTFPTTSGRAEFVVSPVEVLQVPAGHLVLQTLRSHDQFNTTIYGLSDRYRGIEGGRKVIFLHPDDIAALGLHRRRPRRHRTHWPDDDVIRCVRATSGSSSTTPRAGSAAAYYPETNPLVPLDSTALGSNTPTSKSIIVRLARTPSRHLNGAAPVGQEPVGADWDHKAEPQPRHLS